MKNYCQKSEPWGSREIAAGFKMAKYGCAITSIACLDERTPDVVLNLLKKGGAIVPEDMIVAGDKLWKGTVLWKKVAEVLGMVFDNFTNKAPEFPCIAITDHYLKDFGFKHFFVWLNDGNKIIDPLDGLTKESTYKVIEGGYVLLCTENVKKNS